MSINEGMYYNAPPNETYIQIPLIAQKMLRLTYHAAHRGATDSLDQEPNIYGVQ